MGNLMLSSYRPNVYSKRDRSRPKRVPRSRLGRPPAVPGTILQPFWGFAESTTVELAGPMCAPARGGVESPVLTGYDKGQGKRVCRPGVIHENSYFCSSGPD